MKLPHLIHDKWILTGLGIALILASGCENNPSPVTLERGNATKIEPHASPGEMLSKI